MADTRLTEAKADIMSGIAEKKELDDDLTGKLTAALNEFKGKFQA